MSVDAKGNVVPIHFCVAGMMDDPEYQRCKRLAGELSQLNKHTTYELAPLVEVDWERYLDVKKTVRVVAALCVVSAYLPGSQRTTADAVPVPRL